MVDSDVDSNITVDNKIFKKCATWRKVAQIFIKIFSYFEPQKMWRHIEPHCANWPISYKLCCSTVRSKLFCEKLFVLFSSRRISSFDLSHSERDKAGFISFSVRNLCPTCTSIISEVHALK